MGKMYGAATVPAGAVTRYRKRHTQGIRGVHGSSFKPNRENVVKAYVSEVDGLKRYIRAKGIKRWIADIFTGTIKLDSGLFVTPQRTLSLLETDVGFRSFVKNRWRDEDEHMHEWIPCTYLPLMIRKALISGDFRFVWIADRWRSPTMDLFFEPTRNNFHHRFSMTAPDRQRTDFVVVMAHPGGLKFREAPSGIYISGTKGSKFADGFQLQDGTDAFHSAIVEDALTKAGSNPVGLLDELKSIFGKYCWNPKSWVPEPKVEVWPYYRRGDGTVINGNIGTIAQAAYQSVSDSFVHWKSELEAMTKKKIPAEWYSNDR